jgi:hypothetical protein
MNDSRLAKGRRSTRLFISIPIVITGKDVNRKEFQENTRTLVVNKHGAKIVTAQQLSMGTEVFVENRALHTGAKANVVWLGEKRDAGNEVGLQLADAENIWGVEFPPNDWNPAAAAEESPGPGAAPDLGRPASPEADIAGAPLASQAGESPVGQSTAESEATPTRVLQQPELSSARPEAGVAGARLSSPAGENPADQPMAKSEGTPTRILQQLEESADAEARQFQDRLEKVAQQIGLQMEVDLRQRAALAKAQEVGPLEQQVRTLTERLSTAREDVERLEAQIQLLKGNLQPALESLPLISTEMQEMRRQLIAMMHSVVESMHGAAEAAFKEYASLLQRELQEGVPGLDFDEEARPSPTRKRRGDLK